MRIQQLQIAVVLLATSFIPSWMAYGDVTYETIALSGQAAPGAPSGVTFSAFSQVPIQNNLGEFIFSASIIGSGVSGRNNSGLWVGSKSNLKMCLREGSQPSGTVVGTEVAGFGDAVIKDSGDAISQVTLRIGYGGVSSSNDTGIWHCSQGTPSLVAREGNPAEDSIGGGDLYGMFGGPSMNNVGQVTYWGQLLTSGGSFDQAFFIGLPESLATFMRSSYEIPGFHDGTTISQGSSPYVINDNGVMAFNNKLVGSNYSNSNSIVILAGSAQALKVVAQRGAAVPGVPNATWFNFGSPDLNNNGEIVFSACMSGQGFSSNCLPDETGIWSGTLNTQSLIVRPGEQAPGCNAGTVYSELGSPVIGADGSLAFQSLLIGDGVDSSNDLGLFAGQKGSFRLMAREGFSAPGTSGASFSSFLSEPIMNSNGRVALFATLKGAGVTAANDRGIWIESNSGQLELLVRTGQSIEVAPWDSRTISSLSIYPAATGGQDGRPSALTDSGSVVFYAALSGNSYGIFSGRFSAASSNPTHTPTASPTVTRTPTPTRTRTPTATPTQTSQAGPTLTPTRTATPSAMPTQSATATANPTNTPTIGANPSPPSLDPSETPPFDSGAAPPSIVPVVKIVSLKKLKNAGSFLVRFALNASSVLNTNAVSIHLIKLGVTELAIKTKTRIQTRKNGGTSYTTKVKPPGKYRLEVRLGDVVVATRKLSLR